MIVLAVAARELRILFGSPLAWVVLVGFTALAGLFYVTNLGHFVLLGQGDPGRELWPRHLDDLRFALAALAPLVTMRLIAGERRLGSMDVLSSLPVSDAALVTGKLLASMVLLGTALALVAVPAFALGALGPLDPAPLALGFGGLALVAAAFLACGLLVSSVTTSPAVAATGAYVAIALLWAIDWSEALAPPAIVPWLRGLSLFDRFEPFTRGVLELRHLAFFASFVATLLFAAVLATERRRGPRAAALAALALAIACAVLGQRIAERRNVTFDVTAAGRNTIGASARAALEALEGPIEILGFHERGRRPAMVELLGRFEAASPRVRVRVLDLDRAPATARAAGIERYGAARILAAGREVVVDADGEDSLASGLHVLARGRPLRVGFLAGHDGPPLAPDRARPSLSRPSLSRLGRALEEAGWDVGALAAVAREPEPDWPPVDVVVIAGVRSDMSDAESRRLAAMVREGGGLVVLLEPDSTPRLEELLASFGVGVVEGVLEDRTGFRGDAGFVVASVVTTLAGRPLPAPVLVLPRALRVVEDADASAIASTAPNARLVESLVRALEPRAVPAGAQAPTGSWPVAVVARTGAGRVVVVGDVELADDRFLGLAGNRRFLLDLVSWAGDVSVAGAPSKATPPWVASLETVRAVGWGFGLGLPVTVGMIGLVVVVRRRRA